MLIKLIAWLGIILIMAGLITNGMVGAIGLLLIVISMIIYGIEYVFFSRPVNVDEPDSENI